MQGYSIIYWGDANEVAYLSWDEIHSSDPEQEAYASQWETINPAFARFLSDNHVTEVLEHCPHNTQQFDMQDRLQWWGDRLREQGYVVV